ncbi:MAG: hypothetical protein H6953_08215 [Chromatiaceae bacterium]|nr:hypothetical protein [Chromatiaceae bacterium]MCP5315376.1 hypothetical protein [Chromatiaceae bacterium]
MMRRLGWVIAICLGVVLVAQWYGWSLGDAVTASLVPPPAVEEPDPATMAATLPKGTTLGALEDYAVIIERPLFSSDRRPAEQEASGDVKLISAGRPQILLSGVVAVQGDYQALVTPGSSEAIKVSVGDDIEGWQVAEILPDSLVLTRDSRREVFELRVAPAPNAVPEGALRKRLAPKRTIPRRR